MQAVGVESGLWTVVKSHQVWLCRQHWARLYCREGTRACWKSWLAELLACTRFSSSIAFCLFPGSYLSLPTQPSKYLSFNPSNKGVWDRARVRPEFSSSQLPSFSLFSTDSPQHSQPEPLLKPKGSRNQKSQAWAVCLRCCWWERELLAHALFSPAPVHNLPWIIIVYQCWKKWLQLHCTHQHKGKEKLQWNVWVTLWSL